MMIVRKPTILIYTQEPDTDFLREICAGAEEEGILFEQAAQAGSSAEELAWRAAEESMLGVGIGVWRQTIAMQIRSAKKEKSVFLYYMPTYQQCRELGENSARAIKKLPFRGLK